MIADIESPAVGFQACSFIPVKRLTNVPADKLACSCEHPPSQIYRGVILDLIR